MNRNVTDEMQGYAKPLYNMTELQMQTAQKLIQTQLDLMGECLEVGSRCTDTLQQSQDMATFFRVPLDAGREINRKLIDTASRQWDILIEARDSLHDITERAEQTMGSDMEKAQAQAGEAAKKATNAVRETTSETRQAAKKDTTKRKEEPK